MSILLRRRAYRSAPPVVQYKYIDPIDTTAFPVLNSMKLLTLNGTENWRTVSAGYYTGDFSDWFSGVSRTGLVAYSEHWEFDAVVTGAADLATEKWMFNGTTSKPVNGNITFKNSYTAQSLSAWTSYLAQHPEHILVPLNTEKADGSIWKPALRIADGATGYWNGASGFVAIYGGIPYYGDNLVTNEVINNPIDAAIGTTNKWNAAADGSTSILIETEIGKYYRLAWDNTSTDVVGAIFRWGFTDTPRPTSQVLSNCTRTTPQATAAATTQADDIYMPIQVKGAVYPGNMAHFSVREMVGYEPPVMLMMGGNPNPEPEPDPEPDEGENAE